jgi:predicted transcriptional regulator
MKDAALTIRLPGEVRRRIEALARREGRSLSGQAERLLEAALAASSPPERAPRGLRSLAGVLAGARTPSLQEFRQVRSDLSRALDRRTR